MLKTNEEKMFDNLLKYDKIFIADRIHYGNQIKKQCGEFNEEEPALWCVLSALVGSPSFIKRIGMRKCSVEGCERKHWGRGYCFMHYGRWRKWGDASIVKTYFKTPELIAAKMKRCPNCKEIKSLLEFYKNKRSKDKHSDYCKKCNKIISGKINSEREKKFNGLYAVWQSMKQRCFNSKCKVYKYYGGRSITVCKEWQDSFQVFYDWAKDRKKKGLEIDRIDNNGNYEPNNCQFTTHLENMRNTR